MRAAKRPGVTLLEVLIAIFIMAIGMLALLTLFPVGALEMARALRSNRSASAAVLADALALAQDIRHDNAIASNLGNGFDPAGLTDAYTNPFGTALNSTIAGPSYGVLVDPYNYLLDAGTETFGGGLSSINATWTGIRRRSLSLTNSWGRTPNSILSGWECDRWCSLLDDLYFMNTGTPGPPAGTVQRGGHYTWSYLLRRPNAYSNALVEMSIIVYRDRNTTDSITGETAYQVVAGTGTAGTNSVTIDWGATAIPPNVAPNVRVGRWIMDVSPNQANGAIPGYMYRVVNYADLGGNKTLLELETNIKGTAGTNDLQVVVLMEDVEDVYEKVLGWQP
jgi:prepilin-type N-terminal cleavage/methylation domain-containing protein